MDYNIINCPKCGKELPVPAELKQCICMYCGENISIEEQRMPEEQNVDSMEFQTAYRTSLLQAGSLIEDYEKLLKNFTGAGYKGAFQAYSELGEDILSAADRYAFGSEESKEQVIKELSEGILMTAENQIEAHKSVLSGNSKARLLDQHRFFLAVYLIPMLSHLKLTISEALIDQIMKDWKQKYPSYEFKKANYEELAAGFERKGFCFITSAVCDTLNKPDDCDELMILREYRDNYLMNTKSGARMINEYYRIAPVIVAYLNMQTDGEERYDRIWKEDVMPCLNFIENGHNVQCKKHYVRMVRRLKSELPF